jgi:hypothetical protein
MDRLAHIPHAWAAGISPVCLPSHLIMFEGFELLRVDVGVAEPRVR